jgi:hypothetical protein
MEEIACRWMKASFLWQSSNLGIDSWKFTSLMSWSSNLIACPHCWKWIDSRSNVASSATAANSILSVNHNLTSHQSDNNGEDPMYLA